MKTYNRTELPDEIRTSSRVYEYCAKATKDHSNGQSTDKPSVIVNVLPKNLRGKEDLHGKPYQPHTFIFVCKDDLSIENSVAIEELEEGHLFKFAESKGNTIYHYLGYDRSEKKYAFSKFTDMNAVSWKKKGTRVVTNFTF
jgi:hypothetical protein